MSVPNFYDAVGLDAGSAWTRCVILRLERDRLRFLGYACAPSQGWTKGRIADQSAAAESMLAALKMAENQAGVSVEAAVVGVGASVRGSNQRGFHDLSRPRTIDQRDVNRAVRRAANVQLLEDSMVLQLFPQDFEVDGHPGHRDPRGMTASQLEANIHLVVTSAREHDCLVTAVNQAHLAVEETVSEAIAASYAAVLPEDRREGAALLNIGAHSAELVAYYGDAVQLCVSLPVGGDHFTRDVARGLRITFEDATVIKHEFGSANAQDTAANSLVEILSRDDRYVSRRVLNNILESRALDLFQLAHKELVRMGMAGALAGGLFLAGGGALLEGMCEIAEQALGCRVCNALPLGVEDWPEEIFDPTWTTVAGLAMYSARLKSQRETHRQSGGLLARIMK
jgi:cell division protein FtsA